MDQYEEVVLVDLSPNKLHRSEGGGGWLIHHCNHAALSLCYVSENKNKPQTNLGGKKRLLDLHYYVDVLCHMAGY